MLGREEVDASPAANVRDTAPARARRRRGHEFGYQPALDGVRGVAVALVVVFHAGLGWLTGGYVGVSVFFTLSGYLITSLALAEHARAGRLDVTAFYGRRVRRLLPASVACLVGVVVLGWTGALEGVPHLRRDLWAAFGQVYNWVALLTGESYAERIADQSGPLDHYWSLAIEEQFYWVWPLVLLGIVKLGRARRIAVFASMVVVAGIAAPAIARVWGPDAAYWATPARLGEILVGALIAAVLHERRVAGRDLAPRVRRLAPLGLAVVAWAALTWPARGGPAYAGWLPVFALASGALIVGLQVDSRLRRVLSAAPLVRLGAISYGVYLYHWPVFAVLDENRVGLAPGALFVLRVTVTLGAAAASYALLEQPIRQRRWEWRPVSKATTLAIAVVAVLVMVAPVDSPAYWTGSDERRAAAAVVPLDSVPVLRAAGPPPTTASSTAPTSIARPRTAPIATRPATTPRRAAAVTTVPATTTPATTTTVPATTTPPTTTTVAPPPTAPALPASVSRPVRMLVVGDSTASATGEGLVIWAGRNPALAQVSIRWAAGCGIIRAGSVPGRSADIDAKCDEMHAHLPGDLAALQPDVVMVMSTLGDVEDRVVDGAPAGPGEAAFDAVMAVEYERFLLELAAAGVKHVVWAIPPIPEVDWAGDQAGLAEARRWQHQRAVIEDIGARHGGLVTVVDVAGWVQQRSSAGRPDGLHLSADAATVLAGELLAPTMIAAAVA